MAGKVVHKEISDSRKLASLSKDALILYLFIMPHLDPFGKMLGGPGYIKDVCVPFLEYLSQDKIKELLLEITEKTYMKWFEIKGRYYIHDTKAEEKLPKCHKDRYKNDLPNCMDTSMQPPCNLHTTSIQPPGLDKDKDKDNTLSKERESTSDGDKKLTPLAILWNTICTNSPKVLQVSKQRREKELLRLKERPLSEWEKVFVKIAASNFCSGQNDRKWWATYDWIIRNTDNAIKVLEGKYDNPKTSSSQRPPPCRPTLADLERESEEYETKRLKEKQKEKVNA